MKPILNLNKHPQNCENLSLVYAKNVRLSNDGVSLQSEEALINKEIIDRPLVGSYQAGFKYVAFIPCNKELIIFVANKENIVKNVHYPIDIWRYNEELDQIKLVYKNYNYYQGRIKGDFTYNVNNDLIIAIAESDGIEDVPLKTINLGKFEEDKEQLSNQLLPINPEVRIPTIKDYNYCLGNLPKGWYYIFIRYKIDNNDYTKWFEIGNSILISDIEKQSIVKFYGYQYKEQEYIKFTTGVLDHFNSESRYSNESIELNIINFDTRYKNYQLAFICNNATDIISYRTVDISNNILNYIFDIETMIQYDYVELITDNYNFYNVKNIINYNNRLYISNYKETILKEYDTSNIILNLEERFRSYDDVKFLTYSSSDNTTETNLTVDGELDYSTNIDINDTAQAYIIKDLVIENKTYNKLIESEDNIINLNGDNSILTINCYDSNNNLKNGIEQINNNNGIGFKITELCKILTTNNKVLNVEFYCEAYYAGTGLYDNIYFKYTINNNSYYARCEKTEINMTTGLANVKFRIYSTDINDNILIPEGEIKQASTYINTKNSFNYRKKVSCLVPGGIYNFYIHFVDKYGFATKGFKLNPKENSDFEIFINKNDEELFKVPYSRVFTNINNEMYTYTFNNYVLDIGEVEIPEGYIGYYLSYEKYESLDKYTGILTKYDFNDTEHLNNTALTNHNKNNNTKMYFYCSDFDIEEKINLKFNKIRIERKNVFKASEKEDIIKNSILQNINNLNVIELEDTNDTQIKEYNIEDYDIQIGSDFTKNRFGLGTVLEIPIIDELFPENEINIYKATLTYDTKNIYVNKEKQLIRCTNIIYKDSEDTTIIQSLNGRNTYNSVLIYDQNKFIYNDGDNKIYTENNKEYIDYGDPIEDINSNDRTAKPLVYIQYPVYNDYFYETKSFKNKPTAITFNLNKITDEESYQGEYQIGSIIKPQNSIDLFENKFVHPDNYCPKYYTNNRTDIEYVTQFDKFVRRSDIIQDESASNAWRQFGLENYKVISENKGKITNIVGIGYYLLVHTEHSLFAFNNNNSLKTLDQEIQLATPDIFDVDYKELVTSELGFAGLQDSDAWCLDNFGYIFYDNDSNRIFRFDEGKLDYIDNDIVQWLNKYKPNQIRFCVDKKSNRVLCTININDITANHDMILSYNYAINKFIAVHEYVIRQAVNTKNELYLINELGKINIFNHNSLLQDNYSTNQCELQIIINDEYNRIKFLEYIIYRLFAVDFTNKDIDADAHIYPVEEMLKPYSGLFIRVYNDEIDTDWLDVQIGFEEDKNRFTNYKLPYWDKGNWNFSYLRDKINKMRLYGNYFVVCFKFGGAKHRYEFEMLNYSITKDRQM